MLENTESTQRQYALRERAAALGWPLERIVVIDRDLGQSGASAADREGFQQLVSEVSLGHVGIVLGLEVSRLARNSTGCSSYAHLPLHSSSTKMACITLDFLTIACCSA